MIDKYFIKKNKSRISNVRVSNNDNKKQASNLNIYDDVDNKQSSVINVKQMLN